MSWYYGTFSCGHEGRVNIIGPVKHRQYKADIKFEGLCAECYAEYIEEQKLKANKEAAKKAKEMELPELIGTENQVGWANTIRQNFIEKIDKLIEDEWDRAQHVYHEDLKKIQFQELQTVKDYVIANKTMAIYYIDNRTNFFKIISNEFREALKSEKDLIEEKQAADAKLESTVFPENAITNVVTEILVNSNKIIVIFEKNDKFRAIVKKMRYKWNGVWERNINEVTGTSEDRAAELGNELLNNGFPICIFDENIRRKAINGEYEQECDRWITIKAKGDYVGRLAITWYDNGDLYDKARKLPGSRWDKPSVVVKIEHYKEVEEFAKLYSFKFTETARIAIEGYKEKLDKVIPIFPTKIEKIKPKDGLEEILNSSADILEDLKED